MRLFTTRKSANGVKALAVVHHLRLEGVEIVPVDVYRGEGRRPEYLAIHPLGKVPALVDGAMTLWESNAILQYLVDRYGDGSLWSTDAAVRADIARWMYWESSQWQPALTSILSSQVAWRLGLGTRPTTGPDWDLPPFPALADLLQQHLQQRLYLVEDRLTVADFSVAAMLVYVPNNRQIRQRWPAVWAWSERVQAPPAWEAALAGSPWAR